MQTYTKVIHQPKEIQHILVPVELTSTYIAVLRQAAELAKQHGATIHLLLTLDAGAFTRKIFPWLIDPGPFEKAAKERNALLDTWRCWVETEFGVRATSAIDWNKKSRGIVKIAKSLNADLVILHEAPRTKKWFGWPSTTVDYVIEKAPCQVMTFFSEKLTIAEWKQVVIPVTDFIPELRIRTILELARIFRFKIHLVTVSNGDMNDHTNGYHFLTEALKRLKPSAQVDVECHVLKAGAGLINSCLNYARKVKADILMTNLSVIDHERRMLMEMNLFADY